MSESERIAAILLSLDSDAAEAVLTRLDAPLRGAVVAALQRLQSDAISANKQRSHWDLAECFASTIRASRGDLCDTDPSELDQASLHQLVGKVPVKKLTALVRDEHPQTVAALVTRMTPDRAAALLQELPPTDRADVLQRVLDTEEADHSAVEQIERLLAVQLRYAIQNDRKEKRRLQRVEAILGAANPTLRSDLQKVVEQRFARANGQPGASDRPSYSATFGRMDSPAATSVDFDRLVDYDPDVISGLFADLPPEVATLALSGASESARHHILDCLARDMAHSLTERLASTGPTRVADIHVSQAIVLRMLERDAEAEPTRKEDFTLFV